MTYEVRDLCAPRPGKDGKTYWVKIGSHFAYDDGSVSVIFDALPLPGPDGRTVAKAFPRKDREDRPAAHPAKGIAERRASGGKSADLDDDIPF